MTDKQISALCRRLNASPWQQKVLFEELASNWHTGTPTEEGWYLCSTKASDFSVHYYDGNEWDFCPLDFVVAWQKITPYEGEEVNG